MEPQRLDKLLSGTGRWSRREVKLLVKQGRVLADGRPAPSADAKYDPETVRLTVDGETLRLRAHTWVMMNKPAGVLSATEDGRCWTCCRRSFRSWSCFRWGGWTRTRRACCS